MTTYEILEILLALVNCIVLSITLFFLVKYTKATEGMASATQMMAKYQITPAIDVNMIYEKSLKKTYFWFSNESNLPGIVSLEFKKNNGNKEEVYKPLRIPPKRSMKTDTTFDFSLTEGDKMVLFVSIKPS